MNLLKRKIKKKTRIKEDMAGLYTGFAVKNAKYHFASFIFILFIYLFFLFSVCWNQAFLLSSYIIYFASTSYIIPNIM